MAKGSLPGYIWDSKNNRYLRVLDNGALTAVEDWMKEEKDAWQLAEHFAAATNPAEYVNIYVVDCHHRPVEDYRSRILHKYPSND